MPSRAPASFTRWARGGAGRFLKDKVLRLLVPLAVGAFSHASLQVYLERVTHRVFSGSYLEFLPHYFDGLYMDIGVGGNFAWEGMHLWYLLVLFILSVAFYPLLRWLKGGGRGVLTRLGELLAFPGAVYPLALPVILVKSTLDSSPLSDVRPGGWSLVMYACFLLAGFVLVSHERLQAAIVRQRWLSVAMASVLMAAHLWLKINAGEPAFATLSEVLYDPLQVLSSWCWILALWGLGMKYLNVNTPFLKYANEAVLPFYILHQTVILSVGYFVVQWAIPDLLKWLIVLPVSFVLIMVLYEFLVRRYNVMRFLFGMKPRPKAPAAQPQQATGILPST